MALKKTYFSYSTIINKDNEQKITCLLYTGMGQQSAKSAGKRFLSPFCLSSWLLNQILPASCGRFLRRHPPAGANSTSRQQAWGAAGRDGCSPHLGPQNQVFFQQQQWWSQIEVSRKTDLFGVVMLHILRWVNRKECSPVKGRPVNSGSGSEYPYDARHRKQETSVKTGNRCGLSYCNSSFYLEVGMEQGLHPQPDVSCFSVPW